MNNDGKKNDSSRTSNKGSCKGSCLAQIKGSKITPSNKSKNKSNCDIEVKKPPKR